jgi:hypothetical protein
VSFASLSSSGSGAGHGERPLFTCGDFANVVHDDRSSDLSAVL